METEDAQVLVACSGPAGSIARTGVAAITAAGRRLAPGCHQVARLVAYQQKPMEPSDGRIVFEHATWVGLGSGAPVVERTAHKLKIKAPLVVAGGSARRLALQRWLRSEAVSAPVTWGGALFRGSRRAAGGDPVLEDEEVDFAWSSVTDEVPEDDLLPVSGSVRRTQKKNASFRWMRSSLASRALRIRNCSRASSNRRKPALFGGPA